MPRVDLGGWVPTKMVYLSRQVSRQAQRAIHQLRLNRLSSTASYQALIRQIESPSCPHCGNGDEMAEHLLLFCPKWAAERQRYFGDSIDITDVFQDYESLVEFLISSGHLSPHIGSAWRACHDNNNNKTSSNCIRCRLTKMIEANTLTTTSRFNLPFHHTGKKNKELLHRPRSTAWQFMPFWTGDCKTQFGFC